MQYFHQPPSSREYLVKVDRLHFFPPPIPGHKQNTIKYPPSDPSLNHLPPPPKKNPLTRITNRCFFPGGRSRCFFPGGRRKKRDESNPIQCKRLFVQQNLQLRKCAIDLRLLRHPVAPPKQGTDVLAADSTKTCPA